MQDLHENLALVRRETRQADQVVCVERAAREQAAIMEAAKLARAYERDLFLADEKQLADFLKAKGMEFVQVDKAAFAAKAKDAVTAALSPEVKPLYDEIVAAK